MAWRCFICINYGEPAICWGYVFHPEVNLTVFKLVYSFTFHFHALEKEMSTHSVFLSGESQGRESLVGCHLWGRTWLKWLSSSSSSKLKSHKSDIQLLNNIALWPRFYLPSSRRTRMSFLKFFCPTPSFFASPPYTKMVHFQNQEKSISTFLVCVLFIYFSAFRFFKIYVWCVF